MKKKNSIVLGKCEIIMKYLLRLHYTLIKLVMLGFKKKKSVLG